MISMIIITSIIRIMIMSMIIIIMIIIVSAIIIITIMIMYIMAGTKQAERARRRAWVGASELRWLQSADPRNYVASAIAYDNFVN